MRLADYPYNVWVVKSRARKELQILDSEVTGIDGKIVLDGCETMMLVFALYESTRRREVL